MSGPVVQSLWIGNRLSTLERLAIASFLANGHEYHLYGYGDVQGVPRGVTLKDGNAILPESRLFTYSDGFAKGSYAAVSNASGTSCCSSGADGGSTPTSSACARST